jgi:hypothetical protein
MASQALAAQCAQLPPRLAPHCLTNDRTSDTYTCPAVAGAIVICNWSRVAANLAYCAFCQPRFLERTLWNVIPTSLTLSFSSSEKHA